MMCTEVRMQKLGVDPENKTLKAYFSRLQRMGVNFKGIKRAIEAA